MSFDDTPEDYEPSYPCECGGSITQKIVSGKWECDRCGKTMGGDEDDQS